MNATTKHQEGRFYEPELDVLRFCTFGIVFLFHSIPSDYTYLAPRIGTVLPVLLQTVRNALSFGVCMFFLLSSYLITKLLIVERETTGSIHLRNFYIRRILRLWPLYLSFLIAMWILGRVGVFYPVSTGRLLAFLFFAGNIYTGLFGFTYNPILPLWSLSIEEQFYIVWPPLLRAVRGSLRGAAIAVIVVAVAATILLHLFAANAPLAVWTNSLVHFQFFALGALIALRFTKRLPTYSGWARAGLAIAGIALIMVAGGPLHINIEGLPAARFPLLTVGYEMMAAGVVLVFLACLGATEGKYKVPSSLTYLGKISFGLFIFHDTCLQICGMISKRYGFHTGFRFIGAACLTLALAMLSYRFLEKPFLLLKSRFAFVQSRAA